MPDCCGDVVPSITEVPGWNPGEGKDVFVSIFKEPVAGGFSAYTSKRPRPT